MANPLISCLMVTLPSAERFGLFQRSTASFQRQTYLDRELVVIANGGDDTYRQCMRDHVAALGDASIRWIDIPGMLPLGALRNKSLQWARGSIVCQWDDDDLYHPQRLELQYQALSASENEAVFLRDVMQLFTASRYLYWTNWHATPVGAFPGSLMCHTSALLSYPETGAVAKLGEDSVVASELLARGRVCILGEVPHLYIYVTHGSNSWPEEHHQTLRRELAVSKGFLRRHEAALRQGIGAIDFGPGPIAVHGSNGAAFVLDNPPQPPARPRLTDISSE
jgi:glycosyltransferase involved in cell wall biosynthesis